MRAFDSFLETFVGIVREKFLRSGAGSTVNQAIPDWP